MNIDEFYRGKYGISSQLQHNFVDLSKVEIPEKKPEDQALPGESVNISTPVVAEEKKARKKKSAKPSAEKKTAPSDSKKTVKRSVSDTSEPVSGSTMLPQGLSTTSLTQNISLADLELPDASSLLADRADHKVEVKAASLDQFLVRDGFDESRDIVGVTAQEGKPSDPYKFSVQLKDLKSGAENGNLDLYLLVSVGNKGKIELPDGIPGITSKPWSVAIGAYDNKNFSVSDEKGAVDPKVLKDLKFNSSTSTVEFSLDKELLRQKGWADGDSVQLQPFTAKDFVKKVTDSLDSPEQKPWANDNRLSAYLDTGTESIIAPQAMPKPPAGNDEINTWKNDLIYFLLTDRFQDGDKTNNMDVVPTDMKKYHGGDIQGIIDKLDYIKDVGATSIWLTPPMKNQTHFFDTDSYHGYWPIDFYDTDQHVGTMEKFKELVDTAHEKGLKIVLDIPLNHTAWEHPLYKDEGKKDWFHHIGDVKDWEDPYWAENGSIFGLPDLAQENPKVEKYLTDVAKFWIDKGIDGFRLDAVKNVPLSFWSRFDKEIHDYAGKDFMLVGEYFDGNPAKVANYQKGDMSSLFDYPLYWTLKDTFAKDGSMRSLASKLDQCDREYPNPGVMSVFLDNHDTPRFLTEAGGNKNKLKLALAFALTINRMPTIYYGTETAMEGNCDIMGAVDNRKDMQWENDPDMLKYFKELTSIRKNHDALREGSKMEMWQDDKIYAYSRQAPGDEVIVILNNGYDNQQRDIPLRPESSIKNGTVLKDLLTGEKVTVQNGKISTSTGGKQAHIFAPA